MMIFIMSFLVVLFLLLAVGIFHTTKKMPAGTAFQGKQHYAYGLRFLRDLTWIDTEGARHIDHEIFDAILSLVKGAKHFVLLDQFLFNDFHGLLKGVNRKLSMELTEVLIAQKKQHPSLHVIVLTDPINTVYGGLKNENLDLLERHGINVVFTRLNKLRDSNILYSPFWRIFIAPFGNGEGGTLSNPFGRGKVSFRSYFRLLNFKANHRKIIIADEGETYSGLITSANPHDGSSWHGNVAVKFSGEAVRDLLATEQAVLSFSGVKPRELPAVDKSKTGDGPTVQIVTEGAIKKTILAELDRAGQGDNVSLVMFYLSDRDIIESLVKVHYRGAGIRVLLDPNKDAFGRVKNGNPNRQVAAELTAAGIPVRWGNTHGEQLHSKMLLISHQDTTGFLILGSANFTRRNLGNFNLETDGALRGRMSDRIFVDAQQYHDLLWNNINTIQYSSSYRQYEDHSGYRVVLYRLMEALGLCTF